MEWSLRDFFDLASEKVVKWKGKRLFPPRLRYLLFLNKKGGEEFTISNIDVKESTSLFSSRHVFIFFLHRRSIWIW